MLQSITKDILLFASGDLRESANQMCWAAQKDMEEKLTAALAKKGHTLHRAHPFKADRSEERRVGKG